MRTNAKILQMGVLFGLARLLAAGVLAVAFMSASFAAPLQPAQYALVIGNAGYSQRPLANPHNDARLMANTLKKLGFTVTQSRELGRKAMFDSVKAFADSLPEGAVAMVYFAGHGMQINGANYLLPTDLTLTSEQGSAQRAYPLKTLMDKLGSARSAVNIVVLDACRDNPFQPPARYRSYSQLGLAKVTSPQGMVVAYSTAPGQQAADGVGRGNSLYTETLAAEMQNPGQSIEKILKNVAERIRKKTIDDQQPWFETSLVDDYYFAPPDGVRIVTKAKRTQLASASKLPGRSMAAGEMDDGAWYMQLNETEWSNFDWEVEQRVKRLSKDEIPLLEQRAKAGNVVAQTTLGIAYREGVDRIAESGTNRSFRANPNNTLSLKWLRQAAEAGFPMAQVELGEMYYLGHGVDRDLNESARWLELASRARYPRARLDLTQVKALGSGSTSDMQEIATELLKNWSEMTQQRPRN
jgi:TPR repeat protein